MSAIAARTIRVTRAGLIGTLVVLVIAATCIRLGLWQLDRLDQREARNALMEARMAEPPASLAGLPPDSSSAYRRVALHGGCEGDQIVLAARSRRGAPGAHVLCRFRTTSGAVVLLDRGWVHSADARTVSPDLLRRAPRDTTIHALLVPFPAGEVVSRRGRTSARISRDSTGASAVHALPRVMYRLNRDEARAVTGLDFPPWYAQVTAPAGSAFGPPYPPDAPDLSSGPHLGYAVQWFSFALIALVGWAILAVSRGEIDVARNRGPERNGTHR